jgi:hypothetical protein
MEANQFRFEGQPGMRHLPAEFLRPPPDPWDPKLGERVLLLFRDQVFEGTITAVLDEGGFVVSAENLLLPVVCNRELLRPWETEG